MTDDQRTRESTDPIEAAATRISVRAGRSFSGAAMRELREIFAGYAPQEVRRLTAGYLESAEKISIHGLGLYVSAQGLRGRARTWAEEMELRLIEWGSDAWNYISHEREWHPYWRAYAVGQLCERVVLDLEQEMMGRVTNEERWDALKAWQRRWTEYAREHGRWPT